LTSANGDGSANSGGFDFGKDNHQRVPGIGQRGIGGRPTSRYA